MFWWNRKRKSVALVPAHQGDVYPLRLFSSPASRFLVLNLDDIFAPRLQPGESSEVKITTTKIRNGTGTEINEMLYKTGYKTELLQFKRTCS